MGNLLEVHGPVQEGWARAAGMLPAESLEHHQTPAAIMPEGLAPVHLP